MLVPASVGGVRFDEETLESSTITPTTSGVAVDLPLGKTGYNYAFPQYAYVSDWRGVTSILCKGIANGRVYYAVFGNGTYTMKLSIKMLYIYN